MSIRLKRPSGYGEDNSKEEPRMETWMIIAVIAIVLALGIAAWLEWSRRRSGHLKDRFGSEYDHVTDSEGRRTGERALRERESRVNKLQIRDLSNDQLQ